MTCVLDFNEALAHLKPDLSVHVAPLAGVEIHLSKALLDQYLFEIASHMLNPLLLPVGKDLHRPEQTALPEVEQLLLTEGNDVRLLSLFLFVFDVGLQDNHA